ncbi:MAG: Gfo/Idh/MocA family oxidoreductase [Candidatus Latescibacterota bacterium]
MKIRAAILGYGRSGSTMHAGAIEGNDGFQMVAVCDTDPERRREAAERFGCAIYDDHHRMLEGEELDLISIVTRSAQHAPMACDCLAAGANVLVTKPWAVDAAEASMMMAAAEASGALLLPWLPARWGCVLGRLQELVAEKTIGNIFLIRHAVCSFATRCDWQTERRHGGGYLLNWGAHIVDPPVVLMGSPVRSVYGRMQQTINPGDAEDLFLAVMTLADGTVVQAEYTVAAEDLPSWFIQGDCGTIVVRDQDLTVYRNIPDRPDDPTQFGTMKSLDEEIIQEKIEGALYGDEHRIYAEIAQALRGEKPFPVQPSDALELSRVFDAIRTSSEQDRVVRLVPDAL